jgi:hypothetical protein
MKIGKIFTPSVRFPLLRKGNRCLVPPAGEGNLQEEGETKKLTHKNRTQSCLKLVAGGCLNTSAESLCRSRLCQQESP